MSSAKRRLKRKGVKAQLITKGYMKLGMNYEKGPDGELRGWWVYPDPREDRMPVRIVKGH